MRDEKNSRSRSWPEWLAPLRPDDVARARMRSAVLERAGPWLERRRAGSVRELAGEAALRLAPLAAAAVLLFGTTTPGVPKPATLSKNAVRKSARKKNRT